jgi:hypothetical protein
MSIRDFQAKLQPNPIRCWKLAQFLQGSYPPKIVTERHTDLILDVRLLKALSHPPVPEVRLRRMGPGVNMAWCCTLRPGCSRISANNIGLCQERSIMQVAPRCSPHDADSRNSKSSRGDAKTRRQEEVFRKIPSSHPIGTTSRRCVAAPLRETSMKELTQIWLG